MNEHCGFVFYPSLSTSIFKRERTIKEQKGESDKKKKRIMSQKFEGIRLKKKVAISCLEDLTFFVTFFLISTIG